MRTDASGLCADDKGWWETFSDWAMGNNPKDAEGKDWVDHLHESMMGYGNAAQDFLQAPVKSLDFIGRMLSSEGDAMASGGDWLGGTVAYAGAELFGMMGGAVNSVVAGDQVLGAMVGRAIEGGTQVSQSTGSAWQGVLAGTSLFIGDLSGTNKLLEGISGQDLLTGERIRGGWMGQVGHAAGGVSQMAFGAAGLEARAARASRGAMLPPLPEKAAPKMPSVTKLPAVPAGQSVPARPMPSGPITDPSRLLPAPDTATARPLLPAFNGTTTGVVMPTNPPGAPVTLTSGARTGARFPFSQADGHLETNVADWMKKNGVTEATAWHNHPSGTCGNCDYYLPTFLEQNSVLRVVPLENAVPKTPRWIGVVQTPFVSQFRRLVFSGPLL